MSQNTSEMRNRRWWRVGVAAVSAMLIGLLGTDAAAVGASDDEISWATSPTDNDHGSARNYFDYTLAPGDLVHDAIDVVNRGTAPITLQVYAADAYTTANGVIDLLPAGEPSVDVGTWVSVETERLTLAPGERTSVPFTIAVPDTASPGDHPGGLVTSLETDDSTGSVKVDRRLGSRLYVRVPGNLAPAVGVSGVTVDYDGTLNPFEPGSAVVSYVLTNTGNLRVTPTEAVTVDSLFGLLSTSSGGSAGPDDAADTVAPMPDILPGSSVTRTVVVDGVWPGVRLGATVGVTPVPSDGEIAGVPQPVSAATASGWAVPWPQLGLLVLIGLVVLAVIVRRRHRAEALRSAVANAVERTKAELSGSGAA